METNAFESTSALILKFRPEVLDICRALKLSCKKHNSVSLYAYHLLGIQFLESLSQICV